MNKWEFEIVEVYLSGTSPYRIKHENDITKDVLDRILSDYKVLGRDLQYLLNMIPYLAGLGMSCTDIAHEMCVNFHVARHIMHDTGPISWSSQDIIRAYRDCMNRHEVCEYFDIGYGELARILATESCLADLYDGDFYDDSDPKLNKG